MKKHRKICSIIAIMLIIAVIVSGITVAAINFGKQASIKQNYSNYGDDNNNENSDGYEEYNDDMFIGNNDDLMDDSIDDSQEYNDDVISGNTDNIPQAIYDFAKENGLSVDSWPGELIDMINKYPETTGFVLDYPFLKDENFYIDTSDSGYETEVPLFLQWDKRWGYTPYGDDMIANAGCGPTCLSMVATHLLKDPSLNPKAIARFSEDYGYCAPGDGSYWSLIYEGGEMLGINVEEISLNEESIKNNLEAGNPIICLVGPGDFTHGGHFIVLTDYVDGKIKINDPNSLVNSQKLWDYEDIQDQIDVLWACSV